MKSIFKFSIFMIVVLSILSCAGNYFYNYAVNKDGLKTETVKIFAEKNKNDMNLQKNKVWFDKNKKDVEIISKVTGLKLKGYEFINPRSKKWVIVVHGFASEARGIVDHIIEFYRRGYNVFAPDLMAHGESEGNYVGMAGYDSKDLRQWIGYISEEYNNPDILLVGQSMGAATVMNTLDENLPDNVKAFIEDSGYIKLEEEYTYQLKKMFKLPYFPIIPSANFVTKLRAGYSFGEVDATDALKNTKLPAMIMHGGSDDFVPTSNAHIAYELLTSSKEIHIFEGRGHCEAAGKDYTEYWGYIDKFLNKYFK